MAADQTPQSALRVRLDVPAAHRDQAAWALEALLARARITNWELAEGDGDVDLALPADAAQWDFAWDREPDSVRDPLAFTFWWLARVEELLAPADAFDEHGRFRFDRSAMSRLSVPLEAPVDDLVKPLARRLAAWRTELPSDAPSWRVVATHDIDLPVRWTRVGRRRAARSIWHDLRRGRLGAVTRTKLSLLAGLLPGTRDPWDNFAAITALERAEGAESTSYLLVGRHAPEDGDAAVHLERWIEGRDGTFVAEGTFGLHGSYTASVTAGRVSQERAELEERTGLDAVDHRFHYLRHRPTDAWPMLARAGMRSDSSLGFAEQPGFRAGTAHPYRAWDHEAGTPLDLVVIPLALMDASFDERYLAVRDRAERRSRCHEVLNAIRANGGSSSVLVHNDRLRNADDDGWTRLYRDLLRHAASSGGRACTAGEAVAAYRALLPAHRRA